MFSTILLLPLLDALLFEVGIPLLPFSSSSILFLYFLAFFQYLRGELDFQQLSYLIFKHRVEGLETGVDVRV